MGAGGHYDVKQVVVVDLDVDIDDPYEIEWAVATRFQADRDLLVVSGAQGSKLDPSSEVGISAKMGIDATKPAEAEVMKFKRIHVKGLEEVDLDSVLQPDAKAAFASVTSEFDARAKPNPDWRVDSGATLRMRRIGKSRAQGMADLPPC
jgi:2,5-furandicarboxylate decarboxylase 1